MRTNEKSSCSTTHTEQSRAGGIRRRPVRCKENNRSNDEDDDDDEDDDGVG